jgi:large subunit ribosomal protein L32
MRRAQHDKVTAPTIVPCPNCSAPMVPHRVCPSCGHYKGKAVVKSSSSES